MEGFWYHHCHYLVLRLLGGDGVIRYATPSGQEQVVACPRCHQVLQEQQLHPGRPWPRHSSAGRTR